MSIVKVNAQIAVARAVRFMDDERAAPLAEISDADPIVVGFGPITIPANISVALLRTTDIPFEVWRIRAFGKLRALQLVALQSIDIQRPGGQMERTNFGDQPLSDYAVARGLYFRGEAFSAGTSFVLQLWNRSKRPQEVALTITSDK